MKKNLAVIFGGRSSEHEVSCVSVVTIAKAVDLEKYNMFLIGITKDGEWKLVEDIALRTEAGRKVLFLQLFPRIQRADLSFRRTI